MKGHFYFFHQITMSIQGSWTKGKLLCPGCSVRLGGFDYVTRATEPVYLVRSKVDISGRGSRVEVVMPRPREVVDLSDDGSESGPASQGQNEPRNVVISPVL